MPMITWRKPLRAVVDDRYTRETRRELIDETLQLANYSAITHFAVVLVIATLFWGKGFDDYLIGLSATITAIIAATVIVTWHYRTTFRGAVSETAIRRGFRISQGLSFAIGSAWGTMPAVLFGPADMSYRLVIVATAAGLISDAYVLGPIFSVSLVFTVPVVVGSFIALTACEAPFGTYLSGLLGIYAIFVLASTWRMSTLSYQRILDRLVVKDQRQTIGLLLNDFEEGTSDWLWETDAEGRLSHVPARMASALGVEAETLKDRTLSDILGIEESRAETRAAHAMLVAMATQVPFRDLALPVETPAGLRWLSLNGKPFSHDDGTFAGYRGVGSDSTLGREAEARIGYLASHDILTGLPNRTTFQAALAQACSSEGRRPVALHYLDLDGFKAVNDGTGHGAGDKVLRAVADRLGAVMGPGIEAFRLGGDEFAVLQDCETATGPEDLATRIVAEIARPFRIDGTQIEIGVSIGIARIPDDGDDAATILSNADLALYAAKAAGRGGWCHFDVAMEARNQRRRQLDQLMRAALQAGELDLHYQPLVNLNDGQVVGFEALLRWHRSEEGWISPAEIIPIAESTGFIVDIGRWALRRACTDVLAWPGMRVAVNISSAHFRAPGFHREVAAILEEVGVEPRRLEIEITESILLNQGQDVMENLQALRALGVRIALDDFGTGYSSLSYLTQFPVDKIKIDRSFVRDLQTRPASLAVVEAITVMARALAMDVTVEGVETQQQSDILRVKRCNTAQGFLFSPARAAREVPDLMNRINALGPEVVPIVIAAE